MLQKAIDTSDLAGGGLLGTEQANRFVDLSLDQSVMLKDARVVRMRSAVMELDKIATGGRVSQLKSEGVAPESLSEPAFSKISMTAVEIITPFEITMEALEDSIERGDLEETVISVMARQTATDLEELAIQGDTGSSDDYLKGLDGWRVLADDGNVVDLEGATLDKTGLSDMYKALPDGYKRNHADLRYYFAPAAVQDWHDTFADRGTSAGDDALVSGAVPPYMGVPVVSVPNIPTDVEGILGYESGPNLTYGLLTPRQNLIFGVHRDVRIDKDKDILRGVNIYTITTRVAVELEEDNAIVVAVNVALGS
jgi:HK97 family phage major capsid protein